MEVKGGNLNEFEMNVSKSKDIEFTLNPTPQPSTLNNRINAKVPMSVAVSINIDYELQETDEFIISLNC